MVKLKSVIKPGHLSYSFKNLSLIQLENPGSNIEIPDTASKNNAQDEQIVIKLGYRDPASKSIIQI